MGNSFASLHGLERHETFRRFIDSYRMRVEDEYVFRGDARGLYGDMDPMMDFLAYMGKAKMKGGTLPDWWDNDAEVDCVKMAKRKNRPACIYFAVERSDIKEEYSDPMMPMQLRMVAKEIEGKVF